MLTIGLTGTSGSGKGYIYQYLMGDDVAFCDTDAMYHSMISRPGECVDVLKKEFGEEILNENGGINRKVLGAIVFSDNSKLEKLNSITHTLILERIRQTIFVAQLQGVKYFFVDAPMLFESGFNKECDYIVGVTAPVETRVERVIQRDNITREKALERFKNQKLDSFFEENCNFVINNNGTTDIKAEIVILKQRLKELYEAKK